MKFYGLISTDLLVFAKRTAMAVPSAQSGRPINFAPKPKRKSGTYWRERRARMFREQSGLCHWCRLPMVLLDRTGRKAGETKIRRIPEEATIEHLDSRLSPERGKHPGERRIVLACHKCNSDRGAEEISAVPIQTLWERTGAIVYIAKRDGALNEVEA